MEKQAIYLMRKQIRGESDHFLNRLESTECNPSISPLESCFDTISFNVPKSVDNAENSHYVLTGFKQGCFKSVFF